MYRPSICVIGLGYIGLPTSIIFANLGFKVSGCDINDKTVEAVNRKTPVIEEPELKERLTKAIDSGNLKAYDRPMASDVYIISVPTPVHHGTNESDLRFVVSATKSILLLLKKGDLIVLESTVPPGTTKDVIGSLIKSVGLVAGQDISLAHAPEKAIPGKLFFELEHNDRIVGGIDELSTDKVYEIYRHMTTGHVQKTDCTTAEMVKLMENTYRDVNIALANEFAKLSEYLGINVWEVIEHANHHPRVNVHQPGPGVGGHCIAVDPWFLVNIAPEIMNIVRMARETNDSMPSFTVNKVMDIIGELGVKEPKVAVLGLAFKANIDDMRESPSVTVCNIMEKEGVRYSAYDPWIKENKIKGQVQSLEEAVQDSDVVLYLVNHDVFRSYSAEGLGRLMRSKVMLDTKNIIDSDSYRSAGFSTHLLGSGTARSSTWNHTAASNVASSEHGAVRS